jgi:hypothetical protein
VSARIPARPSPAARSLCAWLLTLIAVVFVLGCAGEREDGPLWADPGVVRFSAADTHAIVEIHNLSGTVRPIGKFRLGGEDWDTLRFVEDSLPRTIPGRDSVRVELELSAGSFRVEPGVYRSGAATLSFASDQFAYEVPIEFVGSEADRPSARPLLLGSLGLLGLVLLLAWRPLRAGPSPDVPTELRAGVAAAFAGLLLAAATIPVGFGICRGRLGALVGPRELAQCREGLGGAELLALPASPTLWWWLVALAIASIALTVVRALSRTELRLAGLDLALAGLRLVGFTLLLCALLCALAPASSSASGLILVQSGTTTLAGLTLPRWGLVAQPLGFALGFALVTTSGPLEPTSEPVVAVLERLERLVWAGLLVTAFMAGPAIPGLSQRAVPVLEHGPLLALELLAFGLELALILVLGERLRAVLRERGVSHAQLLSAHARWTLPLALLNLIAVLVWRVV